MSVVNLGHIEVISTPVIPQPSSTNANGLQPVVRLDTTSLSDAQAAADFTILQPTYFPTPELQFKEARVLEWPSPRYTFTTFLKYKRENSLMWMVLTQHPLSADDQRKLWVEVDISQQVVGQRPAAFFNQFLPVEDPLNNTLSFLLWEQPGCWLELQSRGLSSAEMLNIAASVQ